jgi:hypothetical protein
MGAETDKAKMYRSRAEELCREAERVNDSENARTLLALAREYDRLAKMLEERERTPGPQNSK